MEKSNVPENHPIYRETTMILHDNHLMSKREVYFLQSIMYRFTLLSDLLRESIPFDRPRADYTPSTQKLIELRVSSFGKELAFG